MEDVVSSTCMSLEAAGQILGAQPGEEQTYSRRDRPTTATYIFRCLEFLDVKWGKYVHSRIGLARAIANNYNPIKHSDRGELPDPAQTYLVSAVTELLTRLLAAGLTGAAGELMSRYRAGSELWDIQQGFNGSKLRVADDLGAWAT